MFLTKEEQVNLVVNNLGIAKLVTNKLWSKYPPIRYKFDTWEDAYQTGLIELMKAAKDFDPNRGFKFTSLAGTYIENKLLNVCRPKKRDKLKIVKVCDLTKYESPDGIFGGGNRPLCLLEEISEDSRSSQDIDNYDNTEEVEYLLSTCSREQKEIIQKYFYEGKTYLEIASGNEACRERYRIRVVNCIKRLKELKCLQYA